MLPNSVGGVVAFFGLQAIGRAPAKKLVASGRSILAALLLTLIATGVAGCAGPTQTIDQTIKIRYAADREHLLDGLRKAGLPDSDVPCQALGARLVISTPCRRELVGRWIVQG